MTRLRNPLHLIAVVATLAWLSIALFLRPIGDFGVETDFYGDFARYARLWAQGEPSVMTGFRGPVYYWLLAGASFVFRDMFLAGKILSVLCAGAALRFVGSLLEGLWDRRVAIFGMLFLLANSLVSELAIRACTDMVFLALLTGTLVLLRAGPSPRAWFAAGTMAAAAYLCRYNGAALLAAPLALGLTALPRAGGRSYAAFYLAWIACVAPWLIFVAQQKGDPLWNQAFQNVAMETYVRLPVIAQDGGFTTEVGFASIGEVIRVDPARFLATIGRNFLGNIWQDIRHLVGIPWAVIALLGVLAHARRWGTRPVLGFGLVGLLVYASTTTVFYGPRFMIPLLVWWAAAVGSLAAFLLGDDPRSSLERWWITRRGSGRVRTALWIGCTGLVIALAAFRAADEARIAGDPTEVKASPRELLELAERVRSTGVSIDANTPVACRKPHFAQLFGAPSYRLRGGSIEDLRNAGVRYLLVTQQEARVAPGLVELLARAQRGEDVGLDLIAQRIPGPDGAAMRFAALFALRDPLPYSAPEPRPRQAPETLHGLDRIDTLRYKLARWYQQWDREQSVEGLLDRLSRDAQGHPAVLGLRANEDLRARRFPSAATRYRAALEKQPSDADLRLALVASLLMQSETQAIGPLLDAMTRSRTDGSTDPNIIWWELGREAMARGSYEAALGPLLVLVNRNSESHPAAKQLVKVMVQLGWDAEAEQLLTRYLRGNPGDQEARRMLGRMTARD